MSISETIESSSSSSPQGLKNREVADAIGTTEHVVKNYLRTIYDKLGLWNRVELVPGRRDAGERGALWTRDGNSRLHHPGPRRNRLQR